MVIANYSELTYKNWKDQGIIFETNVTAAIFDSFQEKQGVQLPKEFRDLYAMSNGTGAMDKHEIIFDQLESIDEQFTNRDKDYVSIVFAGFRLNHYMYQLRLAPGKTVQSIYQLDFRFKERKYLCDSFNGFLEIYLFNTDRIIS